MMAQKKSFSSALLLLRTKQAFISEKYWQFKTLLMRKRSWLKSGHLSKIKNGRHKQRSGQHTLARQINNSKKRFDAGKKWR